MQGLVISAPMLMPWRGMFAQMRLAQDFLFFDDIQLPQGRSFCTRVQIKTEQGVKWLSLPVARAGKGAQLIQDAVFSEGGWRRSHLDQILHAYRKAPFFEPVYADVVEPLYAEATENLSDFCVAGMLRLARALGLATPCERASKYQVAPEIKSNERLIALCRARGADAHVTGFGAMNYIDYEMFESAGIRIYYADYDLSPYPQLHGEFTPFVSVIDMLFNLGPQAGERLGSRLVYWRDWPHVENGRPVRSPW